MVLMLLDVVVESLGFTVYGVAGVAIGCNREEWMLREL